MHEKKNSMIAVSFFIPTKKNVVDIISNKTSSFFSSRAVTQQINMNIEHGLYIFKWCWALFQVIYFGL